MQKRVRVKSNVVLFGGREGVILDRCGDKVALRLEGMRFPVALNENELEFIDGVTENELKFKDGGEEKCRS